MASLDLGIRSLMGLLLLIAVCQKVRSPRAFHRFTESMTGLGLPRFIGEGPAATFVVAGELVTISLLAVPATGRVGLGVSAALLTMMAAVPGYALHRGGTPNCLCFGGSSPKPITWGHVERNAALAAAATTCCSLYRPGPSPAHAVLAIGFGALAAVCTAYWRELNFALDPVFRPALTQTRSR